MKIHLWRGHQIEEKEKDLWVYVDTQEPVESNPERDCGLCGLSVTLEGHDGCLGTLPGVINACCGHGQEKVAFLQFEDREVRGAEAIAMFTPLRQKRLEDENAKTESKVREHLKKISLRTSIDPRTGEALIYSEEKD